MGPCSLLALLLLAFTPIEIHAPIEIEQFALLLAGFVVLVGLDFVLLRRVLAPLFRLTEVMSSVDPDRPGRRLSGVDPRSAEGQAMARAFNSMLDRLENARHEAARTALAAQEAERLRVARELHDEIGQTLTAVTIQAERAADGDPAQAPHALARGSGRRPRELGRGAPHRARAATGGARRPRPRQRADRALPRASARRRGRASSESCRRSSRRCPRRWSSCSTGSRRRASRTPCATPTLTRRRCRSRRTRRA